MTRLLTKQVVDDFVKMIKANGGTIIRDDDCVIGRDSQAKEVFRALRKSKAGPWITRFMNTEEMTWTMPPKS